MAYYNNYRRRRNRKPVKDGPIEKAIFNVVITTGSIISITWFLLTVWMGVSHLFGVWFPKTIVGIWVIETAQAIIDYNWTFPKGILVTGLLGLFTHRLYQSRKRPTAEPTAEPKSVGTDSHGG